jgi:hypothetical protein
MVRTIPTRSEDGEPYKVIEWKHEIGVASDGARQVFPGPPEWTLDDGRGVSRIDDETFKIVQTDVIIRKLE